jgi:hypothetical protein
LVPIKAITKIKTKEKEEKKDCDRGDDYLVDRKLRKNQTEAAKRDMVRKKQSRISEDTIATARARTRTQTNKQRTRGLRACEKNRERRR